MATKYYKATARNVTVTRSTASRDYTHAVIACWSKGTPGWRGEPRSADHIQSSFSGSYALAHKATAQFHGPCWVEVAPVTEIDAKEYRALKAASRTEA